MKKCSEPFPIIEVDNFLPSDFFLSLRSTFPDIPFQPDSPETIYHNRGSIDKKVFSPNRDGVIDFERWSEDDRIFQNTQWQMLISALTSRQVIRGFRRCFFVDLLRERGVINCFSPWRFVNTRKHYFGYAVPPCVNFHFEIHSMGNEGIVHPHRDTPNKVMTLIIQFADDDWPSDGGGDTLFYRMNENSRSRKWLERQVGSHVPPDERTDFEEFFHVFKRGKYRPNHLVGFMRTHCSYHAVDLITANHGKRRKNVILNINIAR